jgi:hypothetical protein
MKHLFTAALVATLLFAAPAFAERDPDVAKAIKSRYADAKTEVTGHREINGVKVYQVKVSTDEGDSIAEITEYGDFLLYGVPLQAGKGLPKSASETLESLFKAKPDDVDQYRATSYLVDVDSGKKTFRMRFDAVGRLLDVDTAQDVKEAMSHLDKATDAGAKKASERALKWNSGLTVENVYFADDSHEYYLVDLKNKAGKDATITVSAAGNVSAFRNEIPKADIPEPVMATMNKLFDTAKLKTAYKAEYQFYEFVQKIDDGELLVRVRANGDIMSITPKKAAEEESPVKKATKKKK